MLSQEPKKQLRKKIGHPSGIKNRKSGPGKS